MKAASALLLLAWAISTPALADVALRGYAKSFVVIQDSLDNALFASDRIYQSQNSLRLMLEGFGDRTVWQVHYELSPVLASDTTSLANQTFNVVSGSYRLTDLQSRLAGGSDNDKSQLYQNLDRFNVQFQFDAADLTIGRQAISFGSARIINPIDVFLPFDVRTLNTEYRTGVDAIRFQRPWGSLGEIDFGVVLGEDAKKETSAAFLQLRNNYRGADHHLALIQFSEQQLAGIGLQTSLGDFGYWFEAARVTGDDDYTRMSTGFDYAFRENVFGQIEYHYNGAGSEDTDEYLQALESLAFERGGVFLLGKHYLIPAMTWQITPLWYLTGQAIINFSDDSAFVSLSAEYNVAANFYMDFGYYHFIGDDLALAPSGLPQLQSEYGPNPDRLYTSISFYF